MHAFIHWSTLVITKLGYVPWSSSIVSEVRFSILVIVKVFWITSVVVLFDLYVPLHVCVCVCMSITAPCL